MASVSPVSSSSSQASASTSTFTRHSTLIPPLTQPENPFLAGTKLIAKKHDPPTPLDMGYLKYDRTTPLLADKVSHLEWCLTHSPAPGITCLEDTRCVEIARAVRVGETCGAQIVLTSDNLIAKLYDPLFYSNQGYFEGDVIDVVDRADQEYITEAAAYDHFRDSPIQGSIMPVYHGSWTLDVPIAINGKERIRKVRMILIEHITGTRMLDIDPRTITAKARENIMVKLIEADMQLHFAGLRHEDLEPRNIMLSLPERSTSLEDPHLRLCIIDYGLSRLGKYTTTKVPSPLFHNPLYSWIGQAYWSDWGWLPPLSEASDWMWDLWGDGGKEGKYVAVEWDPDKPPYPKSPSPEQLRKGMSEEALRESELLWEKLKGIIEQK